MADPVDEYAVHQFKEFGGKMLKSTTKEGLDLGDHDEKNMPVTTRVRDPAVQAEAQQQYKSSRHQPTKQSTQQERGEAKKERSEKVEREEWETVVVKGRKGQRERGQDGRRKEEEREPEVKKDVTDWIVVTRNRRQRKMIWTREGERKGVCEKGSERKRTGREKGGGRKGS